MKVDHISRKPDIVGMSPGNIVSEAKLYLGRAEETRDPEEKLYLLVRTLGLLVLYLETAFVKGTTYKALIAAAYRIYFSLSYLGDSHSLRGHVLDLGDRLLEINAFFPQL